MARLNQNENSLVKRIVRGSARKRAGNRNGLKLGMGDDAALFAPRVGWETILTCDWFLEGTHFLRGKHPADAVGWKCLARAVSDIGAMGGQPRCFLLSLALPQTLTGRWLDEFLGGLRRAARKFCCSLAGGDTTRRREILINVTVVGEVREGQAILRSGAKPGDVIFVSGRLGEAELGLRLLRSGGTLAGTKGFVLRKHLYPEPRLALGQWLAEKGLATALMDLSDGLSSDLPRLCTASGVGARIEETKLPKASVAASKRKVRFDGLQLAINGGDDYELLFTVPRRNVAHIPRSFRGVPLTRIGEITLGRTILLRDKNNRERKLVAGGWDPFRGAK
ncbi:MAG: thiamine-phosphate kinase [Candidatus Acidiferrales bacterium]